MNVIRNLKVCSLILISILFTGCENKIGEINPISEVLIQGNNDERENVDFSTKEDLEKQDDINNEDKIEDADNSSLDNSNTNHNISTQDRETIEDDIILEAGPVFTKSEIPDQIKKNMLGNSMPTNSTISFDELSYLRISHIDYNGNTQIGEMIVSSKLADEVLDIFRDIYNAKFPIEKMNLIDEYGASDHKSMLDNNSSAFCYRTIAGTNKVSNHGLGVAIDINPFYNPHVLKSNGTVNPPEAFKYVDRSLNDKGIIKENDAVYKAFISRGWQWGGYWSNPDYQHFEKKI